MSKRIDAKITCPNCSHQFDFTLYRSIWGEYPENRELVMSDKINVATCPSCKKSTKLAYPFIYTNAKQFLQFGGSHIMTFKLIKTPKGIKICLVPVII